MVGTPTIVIALARMIRAPALVARFGRGRGPRRNNAAGRQKYIPSDHNRDSELTQHFHWRSPGISMVSSVPISPNGSRDSKVPPAAENGGSARHLWELPQPLRGRAHF
jgi:hypothetical protein